MKRESWLYKIRRKGQVVAHRLFSDEFLSKIYFKSVLHKTLNLKVPKTFNEKIQWCKLNFFPQNETVIRCTDKYSVRDYIIEKGYESKLVPLIAHWNSADEIRWDELPDSFVLKCNHGCAYNIIVENKNAIDTNKVSRQLNHWLKEDFGAFNIELHYSKIPTHVILCEQFLGAELVDYKFFCFNGVPKYLYVSSDLIDDRNASVGFFYLDGRKMPLKRDDYSDIASIEFPPCFSDMVKMATDLSKGFPFVRVDFFWANGNYYFAELTFTPSAGMMPFNPTKYDLQWGNELDISYLLKKKGD